MVEESEIDIPALRKQLSSPLYEERESACEQLGQLKTCFDDIEDATRDSDPHVRRAAIYALMGFERPNDTLESVSPLIRDDNNHVVLAVLSAMKKYRDTYGEDYDVLRHAARGNNGDIQRAALRVIGAAKIPDQQDYLVKRIKGKSYKARQGNSL